MNSSKKEEQYLQHGAFDWESAKLIENDKNLINARKLE